MHIENQQETFGIYTQEKTKKKKVGVKKSGDNQLVNV